MLGRATTIKEEKERQKEKAEVKKAGEDKLAEEEAEDEKTNEKKVKKEKPYMEKAEEEKPNEEKAEEEKITMEEKKTENKEKMKEIEEETYSRSPFRYVDTEVPDVQTTCDEIEVALVISSIMENIRCRDDRKVKRKVEDYVTPQAQHQAKEVGAGLEVKVGVIVWVGIRRYAEKTLRERSFVTLSLSK